MCIEIKTKEVIFKGHKSVLVTKVRMLPVSELPFPYLLDAPSCWLAEETEQKTNVVMARVWVDGLRDLLVVPILEENKIYRYDDFEKILKLIKYCGNNLAEVNKKLKEKHENWNRTQTFKI